MIHTWDTFWFEKRSTNAFGIFRILFGLFLLFILFLSFPTFAYYFGPTGILPEPLGDKASFLHQVLSFLNNQFALWFIYSAGVVTSITFTFGFKTRFSSIVLYLVFLFMYQRNAYINSGQEEVMMTLLFISMFAPLHASYSLDEVIKKVDQFKHLTRKYHPTKQSIWPLRLMQVSIALLYFFTGISKLYSDTTWREGMAFYYVTQFDHWFSATQLVFLHTLLLSKLFTYGTLFLEIGFPLFILFKKTRVPLLIATASMHIFMILFFVFPIKLFAIVMLISYISFIPDQTIQKFLRFLFHLQPKTYHLTTIFYDGYCGFCRNVVYFLQAFDGYKQMDFYNLQNPETYEKFPQFKQTDLERELHLITSEGKILQGFFAFRYLTHKIPSLFFLLPVFYFPGASFFGPKIYKWVADNRSKYFYCHSCGLKHGGACALRLVK